MPILDPKSFHNNGLWQNYTTADGLASLQVHQVAQDKDGYLWFATFPNGVSRFDGEEFLTYTYNSGLCGNQVYDILADRQGRLWFATYDGGVCWYDGRAFHPLDSSFSSQSVTCLHEDRAGRIWFCGAHALGYFDGERAYDLYDDFQASFGDAPPMQCWGMAEDEAGQLWIGDNGLIRYDGERFHRMGAEDGYPNGEAYRVNVAVADRLQGGLWVSIGKKIWHYDGQAFHRAPIELNNHVRRIQHDREGRTWFALHSEGAVCYDGDGFHRITVDDGLVHNSVVGVVQDREGLVWFATFGGGVSCYDAHSLTWLPLQNGHTHHEVRTLAADRVGRLWMGFGSDADLWQDVSPVMGPLKAAYTEGRRLTDLEGGPGLTPGNCMALCVAQDGQVWIGGVGGVLRWDGAVLHRVEEIGVGQVRVIVEDVHGRLLFACSDLAFRQTEIIRYDGQGFETLLCLESNLWINALLESGEGALYFALTTFGGQWEGGGIGCLNVDGAVEYYTTEKGLVDNHVEDLLEDGKGALWVATWGGLSRFDGREFTNYTIADGLPNNHVRCLYEDEEGLLWLGTDSGVVLFDGTVFQTIRGLNLIGVNHICQDDEGIYWFAMLNGVACYRRNYIVPGVRIVQVLGDRVYQGQDSVEVSTSVQQVVFECRGLGYRTAPRDMLYTCRLQGFEAEWRPAMRERRVYYQDVPPGHYTFQVRAIDRDLNFSLPAEIEVQVTPDLEVQALREALADSAMGGEFVGDSPALCLAQKKLMQVAETDLTVLILGETGTGKGLAARMVHQVSGRNRDSFIQINCGAIPENLIESELFGHEKGSFSGAHARKLGKVELAAGGTLFLDEIGDMPLEAQVKLLRLLEEQTFERVGGTETLQTEVRVIAATNRDLGQMVQEGSFREDLFFRLQVFPVELPPLRERRADIPILVDYFMGAMAEHLRKSVSGVDSQALAMLKQYAWPGNVRELKHTMERAVIVCQGAVIRREDLELGVGRKDQEEMVALVSLEEHERRYIMKVLEQTGWVIRGEQGAARVLGKNESTLRNRMKKLGIRREVEAG